MKGVLVNLMSQKAEVKYDPAYLMPNQIANRISELGYEATVLESETSGQNTVDLLVRPEISIERNTFFFATLNMQSELNYKSRSVRIVTK